MTDQKETTFHAATMRALRMCDHALELRVKGDHENFLDRGHEIELRRAIKLMASPSWENQKVGIAVIDHLWSEVPHLHPSTRGTE